MRPSGFGAGLGSVFGSVSGPGFGSGFGSGFGLVSTPASGRAGVAENVLVSEVRHVLVLPDRDAAEEAAEVIGDRFGLDEEPQLVRDALAGEDDAEDAQWLVVLADPGERLDPKELDEFAGEWDGWREEP